MHTSTLWYLTTLVLWFRVSLGLLSDFSNCHDDYALRPKDGPLDDQTFTWLAFVHYIHTRKNSVYPVQAPRVVLVHKQFALGAARPLAKPPIPYKLGDLIFGDYEQDEKNCRLNQSQAKMGVGCPRAYLIMPIDAVIAHPEFNRFGAKNSLALVKLMQPLRSEYMAPICLPSLEERKRLKVLRTVFMVDYVNAIPGKYAAEIMAKRTLKLYTPKDCKARRSMKLQEEAANVLCTTGCGMRPGTPILTHSSIGTFELIGISSSSSPCLSDIQRRRLNDKPATWIDVYPYQDWIINVITAHVMPLPYPNSRRLMHHNSELGLNKGYLRQKKQEKAEWRGHVYVKGNACFMPLKKQVNSVFIYFETFTVTSHHPTNVMVLLEVSVGIETEIVCVRLWLPSRMTVPWIDGVGRYNITVFFRTDWLPKSFVFHMAISGKNASEENYQNWFNERQDRSKTGYFGPGWK